MKFTEILENLKKGERVTREKWEKPGDSCAIDFIMYDQKKDKCEFYRDGKYYDEFVWVYEDIIAEDWKLYKEKKPNKKWKPNVGDKYYYISNTGSNLYYIYDEDVTNKAIISIGNCFETKEEAQHMLQKIRIINQLQELSNIKFSENKGKYFIYYNFRENRVLCTETNYVKIIPFEVCFKTREDCQKAIDTIGEENLKKYYFDVED